MPPVINLIGQKFGRLTVLERIKNTKPIRWKCLCACGNVTMLRGDTLKDGNAKSCGCLKKEVASKQMTIHGMEGSSEYRTWTSMRYRCNNPSSDKFKDYGGRGIKVYNQWNKSFMEFYNYIGPKPHETDSIDRINNNGNYEPGNVRWANKKTQANNSRSNHFVTVGKTTKTIAQWAEKMQISYHIISHRLHRNWDPQKAIFQPVRKYKKSLV